MSTVETLKHNDDVFGPLLMSALESAGLLEDLDGEGDEFTLFAPTEKVQPCGIRDSVCDLLVTGLV
jgi:hypothetical protein